MTSGLLKVFEGAARWIWAQIQRFPVPIDELEYVIKAYGDQAALSARAAASVGTGEVSGEKLPPDPARRPSARPTGALPTEPLRDAEGEDARNNAFPFGWNRVGNPTGRTPL